MPIGYQLCRQASLVGARGLLQSFVKFHVVDSSSYWASLHRAGTDQHTAIHCIPASSHRGGSLWQITSFPIKQIRPSFFCGNMNCWFEDNINIWWKVAVELSNNFTKTYSFLVWIYLVYKSLVKNLSSKCISIQRGIQSEQWSAVSPFTDSRKSQ